MRLLIDICHPAHVHFFKFAIQNWKNNGHEVFITARPKECTTSLLDSLNIKYHLLTSKVGNNVFSLAKELFQRNLALLKYAKKLKIDCFTAVGGTCAAHTAFLLKKNSIIFYDSDNATLQNIITYPFASYIAVPQAYSGKLPKKKSTRYPGFHELAYLAPNYFKPNKSIAIANGIQDHKNNILFRRVARNANHDVGTAGLQFEHIRLIINKFKNKNINFIISSEANIPNDLQPYAFQGSPNNIHHIIAACDLLIADSTTMAQEAAVLATPSMYISDILPGITTYLANQYGLIKTIWPFCLQKLAIEIESILSLSEQLYAKHKLLLNEHIDVNKFITNFVKQHYEKKPISSTPTF